MKAIAANSLFGRIDSLFGETNSLFRLVREFGCNALELLRELMAVFDELPAGLRDAINYAPEPLDPKGLATLCRRHGAANVLAMIELKLKRRRGAAASPNEKPS